MDVKKLYRRLYLWYFRYKDTVYFNIALSGTVILISGLLLIFMIIPAVKDWLSVQNEISETRKRIVTINNNIQYLMSLDSSELDDDLRVASTALPPAKDVSGIISVINHAAISSGVGLDDYSFQVGEIAPQSQADRNEELLNAVLKFTVRGNFTQTKNFLSELQQKIPLLGIIEVDAQFQSANSAVVSLSYYHQAFPLIRQEMALPEQEISPEQKALLNQLRSWEIAKPDFATPTATASSLQPPL